MANIILINPKFEASFWGLEYAMPLFGKRANLPPACLPLLAALTPAGHTVTLVDENVGPLDYDRLARADVVGLTGMSVQRYRMREILAELKRRGAFTAVGGPWVTVQEDYFGALADVIFVGEAEETWPQFLCEWQEGRHGRRYEQSERTDMSRVPTPRFDLLPMRHYLSGSVQFSRGCPFRCEFCDIIVTFGRRPRLKSSAQVLAEVEALRRQGLAMAFIVDDNLIGNKNGIKPILRDLIAWQQAHGYPLIFYTEASLDLAEDDELLGLMAEANITSVFIGIESPNEESLVETKKLQNVRAGSTLLERVWRIQRAGLEVWCGMIVGFDHDGPGIFEAQRDFVTRARISNVMLGMLAAIPKTPLHARLAADGRLDPDDAPEFGTNVIPLGMSRQELRDGYLKVLGELYDPKAYFDRIEELFLREKIVQCRAQARNWGGRPWTGLLRRLGFLAQSAVLLGRLLWQVREPELRREYLRRLARFAGRRREPTLLLLFVLKCALHYHFYRFAGQLRGQPSRVVNTI
jgi:radical SAM superfamily enzyme YgiQ (UPF0313 family)